MVGGVAVDGPRTGRIAAGKHNITQHNTIQYKTCDGTDEMDGWMDGWMGRYKIEKIIIVIEVDQLIKSISHQVIDR